MDLLMECFEKARFVFVLVCDLGPWDVHPEASHLSVGIVANWVKFSIIKLTFKKWFQPQMMISSRFNYLSCLLFLQCLSAYIFKCFIFFFHHIINFICIWTYDWTFREAYSVLSIFHMGNTELTSKSRKL